MTNGLRKRLLGVLSIWSYMLGWVAILVAGVALVLLPFLAGAWLEWSLDTTKTIASFWIGGGLVILITIQGWRDGGDDPQ